MEANEFVAKLKANDTDSDSYELNKIYDQYKDILTKLPTKDRAQFSLNILCTLCRNLDKAPKWRDSIDNKALLMLSIDCVRETRAMERAERVKTLACIYHIHKHIVKQTKLPPELILKLSFMPFELDSKHLLAEYSKTYWNILADRLTYIENMKQVIPIVKLLPKLTDDLKKVIDIYETTQFCSTIIVYLIKKLYMLYSTNAKELNIVFLETFNKISTQDLKLFKKLTDKQLYDLYVKFNECLYVIAENASKLYFKNNILDGIVRTGILMFGHNPALYHCLQTFYLNSFCSLFNNNSAYIENILNNMLVAFETTEKLGYQRALNTTYPYLNQFIRLYIEYNVNNPKLWNDFIQTQELCLKIIIILMKKLKNCEQLLKCDNCNIKTGLHDSLRLSFLYKNFLTVSLNQKIVITHLLPFIKELIYEQYNILTELNHLGCCNYLKCFRKCQTDVHNTAITLNKACYYEFSINLFDLYIKYELNTDLDMKNISRALYNKSICGLDAKLYENALIDAFLSLTFAGKDGLDSEKFLSLVMDIKSKELKEFSEDEGWTDRLQIFTVLDAVKYAIDKNLYGSLKIVQELEFSSLLNHEFEMYAKLWPSMAPIAGVWRSYLNIYKGIHDSWIKAEEKHVIIWYLYEIIVKSCSYVRTIHNDKFSDVVMELLEDLRVNTVKTEDMELVHATLLFLKAEFDLAAASKKYGWKTNEPVQILDPDQVPATRTIPQEYNAMTSATEAVDKITLISDRLNKVTKRSYVYDCLPIYEIFIHQFLHMCRFEYGLQLAYLCCIMAEMAENHETYIRCAGVLLYNCTSDSNEIRQMISNAGKRCKIIGAREETLDTICTFMCDAAIYFYKRGSLGVAAKLTRLAQGKILAGYEKYPNINLEYSVGRVLECQMLICKNNGPSNLTAVNRTHRHYMSIVISANKWSHRRRFSLSVRTSASICGVLATITGSRAAAGRGAAAAAPALNTAAAAIRAHIYTCIVNVEQFDDAQIKIDNRIKHVLGLQPSNETQPYYKQMDNKTQPTLELEPMVEQIMFKKNQTSPTLPYTEVPAFKVPEFLLHNKSCVCYACQIVLCSVLVAKTSGLEATVYNKVKEHNIARNYYDGARKIVDIISNNFKYYKEKFLNCNSFIVNSLENLYLNQFKTVVIENLIEIAFFELKLKNFDVTDEYIVEIHEVLQEIKNAEPFLSNELMNLMIASYKYRKVLKIPNEIDLEIEFENMKLSPEKIKTPELKMKPPKDITKKIVPEEEIFKKRKVIKLNLDDDEKDFEKPKKSEFKIPVPKTTKPNLEMATPRPKSKPQILVTQPSEENSTPMTKNIEFFTPSESTPEQFFTPMSSIKCYTKKSLRKNIVKNLEHEFSTPKSVKNLENKPLNTCERDSRNKSKRDDSKRVLKRATSPGKLTKEVGIGTRLRKKQDK